MPDRESILAATEDVLRRYGPAKASVVDVARVLGVSHAAVYRHFPSKAALREAVTRRWLDRALPRLARIADGTEPAPERLQAWLTAVFTAKREAVTEDPELFETYGLLAAEHSAAAADHVADLRRQLERIVSDFGVADPIMSARAVFEATTAFHHPAHAREWSQAGVEERFGEVCDLVLAALSALQGHNSGRAAVAEVSARPSAGARGAP